VDLDVAGRGGNPHQLDLPGMMQPRQVHKGEAIVDAGIAINKYSWWLGSHNASQSSVLLDGAHRIVAINEGERGIRQIVAAKDLDDDIRNQLAGRSQRLLQHLILNLLNALGWFLG